jgi:hypothetical protein
MSNVDRSGFEAGPAGVSVPADLELTIISTTCGGGSCPTVYLTDRGTVVVQGKAVAAENAGIEVPEGELLVVFPRVLWARGVPRRRGPDAG